MNKSQQRRTVFLTGATGLMGSALLKKFEENTDRFEVRILARKSAKNEKKLSPYLHSDCFTVVWGDLNDAEDVKLGLGNADIVIHLGGMVPPVADHYPRETMRTNVKAARNVVNAIKSRADSSRVGLVYMGSVAQMAHHDEPRHWGRSGDPMMSSVYDYYGLSKILAEREIIESGLKWVSLRQSGVLHPGLLQNGLDPIALTVPLRGVLEWTTIEDSVRLLYNVCDPAVPEDIWRRFYNISSGKEYRMSNYLFECKVLKAVGCPPPEKCFRSNWFATRNFHGFWYTDSDALEDILHFRANIPVDDYFKQMASQLPTYFKLAPLAPPVLIRALMKHYANTPGMGTLNWLKRSDMEGRVRAFFGSRKAWEEIPDWNAFNREEPSREPHYFDHGYDESKPESELDLNDMKQAARFRGGECLSGEMKPGDLDTPLRWRCCMGHEFTLRPRSVLLGGHWCAECLPAPWRYDAEARRNPFLAQVWYAAHERDADEIYD